MRPSILSRPAFQESCTSPEWEAWRCRVFQPVWHIVIGEFAIEYEPSERRSGGPDGGAVFLSFPQATNSNKSLFQQRLATTYLDSTLPRFLAPAR